jgi:hypothetical protein
VCFGCTYLWQSKSNHSCPTSKLFW